MVREKFKSIINFLCAHREALVYVPVYFFISFTDLVLKLRHASGWQSGNLVSNHTELMAFQYYNNEQSRILQFLVPEALHRVFDFSIITSYAISRLVFVFLAFVVFHYFLRKWFSPIASFAGVMILSAALPVTFLIHDLQESAPLLMLMFILGLWAIREEKDLLFTIFMLIGGGLTNESMLVLPLGYFLYRARAWNIKHLFLTGLRTILVALPAFAAQGILRYITRFQPHLGGAFHWPDNIEGIWAEVTFPYQSIFNGTYIYPFLVFSIFWLLAIIGLFKSPRFLRRVFWITPFFVAANLVTGKIMESRQMIPLGFIIIPLALFILDPEAVLPENTPKASELES
jgi:hypothetical protein